MKKLFSNPLYFNVFSAFVAGGFWGGWAYFVNSGDMNNAWISGLTQGVMSFIITFFMASLATYLYSKLTQIKLLLAPLLTIVITGVLLSIVHAIAATPNIFYTIAPTLFVSFFFCLFICHSIDKKAIADN